ncbi:MAG: hypothetical protein F6K14_34890, partial [Symploca sp. SIO2C1]|nr:hypothetical protein [Symploca sp. SIO2C1]
MRKNNKNKDLRIIYANLYCKIVFPQSLSPC